MLQVMHPLSGRHVLVVGLGISGQSAAQFLLKRGASVVGVDRSQELLSKDRNIVDLTQCGMKAVHESQLLDIKPFDLIVVSPGVPPTNPYYHQARAAGIEVIGEVELACRDISQKCLAVTGTNGKTTVTLLIEHILNVAGITAKALGNIGTPLTSAVDMQQGDVEVFVVELSSFQLETIQRRFIDAAVILNITADHLDRYASMDAYAQAKIRLKECLKPQGKLFVEERCFNSYRHHFGQGELKTYGYSDRCDIYSDTKNIIVNRHDLLPLPPSLAGKHSHDLENAMAAYALCHTVGINSKEFLEGYNSFKKPSHRIEYVRTIAGVRYYDDSKGTNLDAVLRAVDSIEGNIVLIAGGVDKGASYRAWIDSFSGKVKSICAIGQAAEKINSDLKDFFPVRFCDSLEDAVVHAAQVAKEGEAVLLSPGCSSYDMFKDYAHRGQEFQRIVIGLCR